MLNADDLKTLLQVAAFGSLIAAIGFVADQCTNPRQVLTITTLEDGQLRIGDDDLGAVTAMTPITHKAKPGTVYVEPLTTKQGVIRSQALITRGERSINLGLITFKDTRDDTTYKASWHGLLLWMSDNLRFDLKGSITSEHNSTTRLYTWEQAQGACPTGWRLPSHDELNALTSSLGDAHLAGSALNQSDYHLNCSFTPGSSASYWSGTSTDDHNASALQLQRIAGYTTARGLNEQELYALDQREKQERLQTLNDRRKQEERRRARVSIEIDASISVTLNTFVPKKDFNPVKCVRPFKGDINTLKTH